jgi:hypothetical protein
MDRKFTTANRREDGIFQISNQAIDRHESTINVNGWQLDNYRLNPVVMYLHSANYTPDPDLVLGTSKVWIEDKELLGAPVWDVDGPGDLRNVLAAKVKYKLENGILRATSVGFIPIEHGPGDDGVYRYEVQDLHEWSIVPVPSNPYTLMKSLESWHRFYVTEGLQGDDLSTFISGLMVGAPKLLGLDNEKSIPLRDKADRNRGRYRFALLK